VQDLGSTNGTFVDGKRAEGPVPLRDGSVLFLGSQVVVFRIVTGAEMEAIQQDMKSPFGPLPTGSPSLAMTCAKLARLARSDSERPSTSIRLSALRTEARLRATARP